MIERVLGGWEVTPPGDDGVEEQKAVLKEVQSCLARAGSLLDALDLFSEMGSALDSRKQFFEPVAKRGK
jgi:hypothetical protein